MLTGGKSEQSSLDMPEQMLWMGKIMDKWNARVEE
jgi:hypothetical protein